MGTDKALKDIESLAYQMAKYCEHVDPTFLANIEVHISSSIIGSKDPPRIRVSITDTSGRRITTENQVETNIHPILDY